MKNNVKTRENRVRRQLARQGYRLQKSRTDGIVRVGGIYQGINVDDYGGYRIIDASTNMILAGEKFDLDLETVERWGVDETDQEESAQKWAQEQADIWEAQQWEAWKESVDTEFDEWADEERERWKEAGLTDEEEYLLQSQLDEAREDWDEEEQGDFEEWAAEERERWEEWTEKDEDKFQEFLENEREKTDEEEAEKFADWVADHRPDIEQELIERYYEKYVTE